VSFNYAGSTSKGGIADNSQLLDSVDSTSFLRSDVSDTYTSGALTMSNGTVLDLRNAATGLRLSANSVDGDQFIYFFDNGAATAEFLKWDDLNSRFDVSDPLHVSGSVFTSGSLAFDTGQSFSDGGSDTILTLNSLQLRGGGLCVDDGVDVVGTDQCFESTTSNGALRSEGTMTVGALGAAGATALCRNDSNQIATCSSSARYKDDVAALPFDGDRVLDLRPVQFTWKDSGEPGVGLVAEEVAEALPELVTYNDAGEVEGVQYDKLTVYLLELLKQHEAKIAELEAGSADSGPASSANESASLGNGQFALVLLAAVVSALVTTVAAVTIFGLARRGGSQRA
jgi:hypothetical protein